MTGRKFKRMLLLLAASAVLLGFGVLGPMIARWLSMEDDIHPSIEDAFVEGDLTLTLSSKGNDPIYYTLDGSIPTLNSLLYEGPVSLKAEDEMQSCVIRACTYDENTGVWGDLFTRTYFYARELETLKERFSTYIVCLTSDPVNLYDYEKGIMVEGKIREDYINSEEYIPDKLTQPANFTQEGRDWERDVYVEILSPEGERLISQNAGIRIFGHASRQYYYKSFKLYAREEYGNASFDYPLFPDNLPGEKNMPQESYERLVLRSHGFDKSVTLFREELFQRLCSQIPGIDSKSVAAASVWLNGAYYNFEWLQEVYDDRYMEENYGIRQFLDEYRTVTLRADRPTTSVPPELVSEEFTDHKESKLDVSDELQQLSLDAGSLDRDILDAKEASLEDIEAAKDYGKLAAYAEKDLTDDAVFEEFCRLVDPENMIQYFAIETYIANWDWPLNNVKLYRYYSTSGEYGEGRQDGRWRYLYYDMEAGFNIFNEPEEKWLTIAQVMEESSLFGAVMKRPDMQQRFAFYLEQCIHEYFTETRVREMVEQLKTERDGELRETFAYKQSQDPAYTMNMEEVEQNIEILYDFVRKRPESIRKEMQELFQIDLKD